MVNFFTTFSVCNQRVSTSKKYTIWTYNTEYMYILTPPYNIFMIQKLRSCFGHFSHEQFLEVKVKLSFALASPEVIAMIDHKNLIEVTFVFLLLAAQWVKKIEH